MTDCSKADYSSGWVSEVGVNAKKSVLQVTDVDVRPFHTTKLSSLLFTNWSEATNNE